MGAQVFDFAEEMQRRACQVRRKPPRIAWIYSVVPIGAAKDQRSELLKAPSPS
jgi:hypothetical protein